MSVYKTSQRAEGLTPVLRRMAALGIPEAGLAPLFDTLKFGIETLNPRAVLQMEQEPILRPRYILSGWAIRQRLLSDGRRQVFSVLLPGDGIGVCLRPGPLAATTTVALTAMTLADGSGLLAPETLARHPVLALALAQAAAHEEALLLDQLVRLGRQTAYERLAHLMLELNTRLEVIGRAADGRFDVPLTQEVMADILGLSVVHVNRTLQQLRRERMLVWEGGQVTLLDRELLASVADYTPPRISR